MRANILCFNYFCTLPLARCDTTVPGLLKAGSDPNARNKKGGTPLAVAASEGCRECFKRLLAAGADPFAADGDGETPLHKLCLHDEVSGG